MEMSLPSKTVIDVLTYLMPGFIAAAILHNLTPAPRPIPFERVVLALIFTIVVQVLTVAVKACLIVAGTVIDFGYWTDSSQLVWSVMLAASLGLVVAYLANTDQLHALLRKVGITHQTSFSSEWYGALCQNRGYMVLHLVGQRRLYGWAEEWPSAPDAGHFVITQAEWLLDENGSTPLTGVDRIVIKASDVEMVELMAPSVLQLEAEDGRSQTT